MAADAEAIVALVAELNRHQGDPTDRFTLEVCRADVFGPQPRLVPLVAELGGALAGYAFIAPTYESGWASFGFYLSDLYVRPEARRRGIARALVAAAAGEASRRGAGHLWWVARAWNDDARAFYRALGAIEEKVTAHALVLERFGELAEAGKAALDNR